MFKHVYLAGPIGGVSYDEATEWRNVATRYLAPQISTLDPMRGKSAAGIASYPQNLIVPRDLMDIRNCDAMLVNGTQEIHTLSIGTLMELGIALERGIPVFMASAYNPHPFLAAAVTDWSDHIETATDRLKDFLL